MSNDDTGPSTPMFPDYENVRFVAQGGFGRVYRATHTELGRDVAIKTLINADPEGIAAFREEARRLAALNVAGVIAVYDFRSDGPDGMPYLVTEWVDAGTLEGRRGLTEAQVRKVGYDVASILAQVHAAGILHRDIKPANIFVSSRGEVKVGDFGIARAYTGLTSTSSPSSELRAASFAFAPMEFLRGERRTERSDVYSLAATLYALVTGLPPYTDGAEPSPASVMAKHMSDPVPHLNDHGMHGALADAVHWGMQKDPAQRPASAQDFAEALAGRAAVPATTRVVPPPVVHPPVPEVNHSKGNRGLLVALIALVAVLGAAVLALALRDDSGDRAAPPESSSSQSTGSVPTVVPPEPDPEDSVSSTTEGSSTTASTEPRPAKPVDLAEQVNKIEGECWPPNHSVGATFRGVEGEWWNCDLGQRYSSVDDMRLRVVLGSRFGALTLTFGACDQAGGAPFPVTLTTSSGGEEVVEVSPARPAIDHVLATDGSEFVEITAAANADEGQCFVLEKIEGTPVG